MATSANNNSKDDPHFVYKAPPPRPSKDASDSAVVASSAEQENIQDSFPPLEGPCAIDLGTYCRRDVSNLYGQGRAYFDLGLRHVLCYQHEAATHCFLACLWYCKDCALAHALIALCHAPNYNFKGEAYYVSTHHTDPETMHTFPSQQLADHHSKMAMLKIEELRKKHKKKSKGKGKGGKKKKPSKSTNSNSTTTANDGTTAQESGSTVISDLECQLCMAIRILTCCPGIDYSLSDETVGRPYAEAMQKLYEKYPQDPEISYLYVESFMILHAWKLYEYPTGKPLSPEVELVRHVLEKSLKQHPKHAGLCHMYVHLSEMSSHPEKALIACPGLRTSFPHAGHLIHMSTHIDVLIGDYESVVKWNYAAIRADDFSLKHSPETAGTTSFYFGYIVHNYHMLVYGAILGGYEGVGEKVAQELNSMLTEDLFCEYPDLVSYLESYSALDIHLMVRFGRWQEILNLPKPKNETLMLYRAASLAYARGVALAQLGCTEEALEEADRLDELRQHPEAEERILHNNQVSNLLAVDAPMLRGEIEYAKGNYEKAFELLEQAVELQDSLLFDEPWGKMQPVRHALGGLLLEQNQVEKATVVFRTDLKFHPNNPWALTGLIACLKRSNGCCNNSDAMEEIQQLQEALDKQRQSEWADFHVTVACACCASPSSDTLNGSAAP